MKRSLVVLLMLLMGWSALALSLAQSAQSGATGSEITDELTGDAEDSLLARYALALESLDASVAAFEGGLEGGAASLDALERAARTLRPLSQDTDSATIAGAMEATFARARTAIQNESAADLAVQVAVLRGGFRRLLYEAAVRDANAGDYEAAAGRLGALATEMGLSTQTQDALSTFAENSAEGTVNSAALRLTFEKGVAAALQEALARVQPEQGLGSAYPALAEGVRPFHPRAGFALFERDDQRRVCRRHKRAH